MVNQDQSENPAKLPDGASVGTPAQADASKKLVEKIEREVGPLIQGAQRKQVLNKVSAIVRREVRYFQGPLPPPEIFEGYEKTLPGAADRIMTMAEQSLETELLCIAQGQKDENADRKLGMWLGFGALCVLTLSAVVCTLAGYQILGVSFIGVGVVGVIARFISGRGFGNKRPPPAD